MDLEFDEFAPNMDYCADDVDHFLGNLDYEQKYNYDNMNCQ